MLFFKNHTKQQGFTLIELMVAITLLAIFATLAVPAMGDMIARQRVRSNAETIANTFNFARSESVRLNRPILVVPGQVKVDGKLNGIAKNWTVANAVLAYRDSNNNATYNSNEDVRIGTLSNRISLNVSARALTDLTKDKEKSDNYGFSFQTNGLMRIKTGFLPSNANQIGLVGRIVVADSNKPQKYCRVIRIESATRTTVCSDKDTRDAKVGDFCHCAS